MIFSGFLIADKIKINTKVKKIKKKGNNRGVLEEKIYIKFRLN
jgi:hypothetical protein